MKKILGILSSLLAALVLFAIPAFAVANYFNGFETDTADWNNFGGTITRVATGSNGISSSDGLYHAETTGSVFTRWGGYESVFPTDGYITKIDIYLDMSLANGSDKRLDFSSAINGPDGNHRRDFIFNIGTVPGSSPTNQWAISASNNAPGWPLNPDRNSITLTESGWYTLEHTFQNNGSGVLAVTMKVKDSSGVVKGTWVLSDPSDTIGTTVGGNRYGWFTSQRFDLNFLAFDNSEKITTVPLVSPTTDKNACKKDGWKDFNNPTFKNQGDCVSYVQSNENAVGNKTK